MNIDDAETLLTIAKYITDANRYGAFVRTIIGTEKEDLAPYFAKMAASSALKASSLYDQISGNYYDSVFYHDSGSIYETGEYGNDKAGWYFWTEDQATYMGPYESSRVASDKLLEYAKQL